MRKESLIALFVCGCLSWSASLAAVEWTWNPFSKRTAEKRSEPTIPSRSNSLRTPLNPIPNDSNRQGAPGQTSLEANQQLPSAAPITHSTYRLILEESKNYPPEVRQNFVKGFTKLTDREARQRIERIRLVRAEQAQSRTNSVAAGDYTRNVSWEQMSYQQAARSPEQQIPPSSPGVAATKSQLPDWSQFTRQSSGHSSTNNSSVSTVRKPVNPNLFPTQDPFDDPSQTGRTTDGQNGVARVPQQNLSQSGPRIIPTGHSPAQLPKIRPAGVNDDHSHYATHYTPGGSAPQQNAEQPQTTRPYDTAQPVSRENPGFMAPSTTDRGNLETIIAQMESLAQQSQPGSTEASLQRHVTTHVELRLLYLVSDEKDRALMAIPGLSREEQIFWTRVFWGLTNYLDQSSSSSKTERTTVALDQLRHAIQSLQGDAGLTIRNAEFCSEIENFGNYTRYDQDEFAPGQEILLYCELENFKSEQIENGIYRTLLKSSIQIRKPGANGELVEEVPYNPTEDLCRSQRKDFMQGFKYRLPQRLTAGSYVLELVIEDQLSGKSARSLSNFVVK